MVSYFGKKKKKAVVDQEDPSPQEECLKHRKGIRSTLERFAILTPALGLVPAAKSVSIA